MKLKLLIAFLFTIPVISFAQIGIGTPAPNVNSELDIVSTSKGVLLPRMSATQRLLIPVTAADAGLLVFQTDAPVGLWYWNGSAWVQNNVPSWNITGNGGTAPATNFLGTTDDQPLIFKTNNVERMRILPSVPAATAGYVGIGTPTPTAKLHIVSPGAPNVTNDFETAGSIAPFVNGIVTGGAWNSTNTAGAFTVGARGAQSGTGVTSSISQMVYSVTVPASGGTISFDVRVSSESGFDFFRFFINGAEQTNGSGEVPWTSVSFPLPGGTYNIMWQYSKDSSANVGTDRAYVDNVVITNNASAFRYVDGSQAAGRVLTSDATGLATWTTPTIPAGTNWITGGNAGTTASNFVGTTDPQDLAIRTNNIERARVLVNGNVGIGVVAPTSKLQVEADIDNQAIIRATNTNTSAGTASNGIRGEASSTSLGSAGVVGVSNNSGQNEMGVIGDYGLWGAGVFGLGDGGAYTDMTASVDYGVFGTVNVLTGTGVYGKNANTTIGSAYGMYCEGNFAVTGTKSASVPTTKGNQLLYCTESPELWFEDLGFATLTNGEAHVKFDELFLETVHIDDAHKTHVFLQEQGDSNGLVVTIDSDNKGFTVKEKRNGTSNIDFSYRILAKRRFYQNQRFGVDANQPFENNLVKHKDIPVTTTDPNEMKKIVDEFVAKKQAAYNATKK